jgi:hypothetical protein
MLPQTSSVITDPLSMHVRACRFPVLLEDCETALSSHGPHMVLASWMPLGQDWTAAMRATPPVEEYVLIGQPDSSMCGDAWLTWGIHNEAGDDSSCSGSRGSWEISSVESADTASSLGQEGLDGRGK